MVAVVAEPGLVVAATMSVAMAELVVAVPPVYGILSCHAQV